MKASIQIIRNVMTNWGATAIATVIGFLMMPFVIHQLGDVRYGIWVIIMNFIGYLGLFDLGVAGSIEKYVAEYKGKNDNKSLNEVCSTSFYLYIALGLLTAILAAVAAIFLIPIFNIPPDQISTARYVTLIVGLQIGISLPMSFFSGFMRGMQRYDLLAIIRTSALILHSLAIIFFLLLDFGLVCLATIHLVSASLSGITRIIYVFRINPSLILKFGLIKRDKISIVSNYSLYMFLFYLSNRLIFSVGAIIIGYFLNASSVTLYAIAQRLIDYMRMIIMGTGVIRPTVSRYEARGEESRIRDLLIQGTKYSLMIAFPIGASYIFIGQEFVSLWVGERYAAASYPVLAILTIGIMVHISKFTSTNILQGLARHHVPAYIALCEMIANIILSVILIKKYGIIGVAIGSMIPMFLLNVIIIQFYACRVLSLSPILLFKESYLKPMAAALLYSLALYLGKELIEIKTWLNFFIVLLILISFYINCAFFICLSKSERSIRYGQLRAAFKLS